MNSTQQKNELFKQIWNIADNLGHTIGGWNPMEYVLGILFYRFISENITQYINKIQKESGIDDFNYSTFNDSEIDETQKQYITQNKGFFIYPSELFENVLKKSQKDQIYFQNLNINLTKIFKNIESSSIGISNNNNFEGLFSDIDFDNPKLGQSPNEKNRKILILLESINDFKINNFSDSNVDIFGDTYEYLIRMYASNAGKKGGEFFTPQEVSELLVQLSLLDSNNNLKKQVNKVYDPCCGSGSLLLKYLKFLGKDNIKIGIYGQEINPTTYNLAKMNMILHNINYDNFDIKLGDTLLNPKHKEENEFDAIVSNPPYSVKWDGSSNPILINDSRFSPAGILAPQSKADIAFTMHILYCLSSSGTASIVEFPGVLYRSGAEQKIRQYLIDNNFIDCIIQLPENLFFGTSISTCILILKKNKKDDNVLFIDASNQFIHEGNKNKLSNENINNIIKSYKERKDIQYNSKLAKYEEIKNNEYNLSVSKYVEKENNEEEINIIELNSKIKDIVEKENNLRIEIDKIIEELEVGNQ